ncbi:hypothetical protein MSAN_02010400 [Mycena sanguinolenta]|uniref:Uncharacterized protein n=1 Tax=Mycena sanguinolenta TaxID=230812 RepID=A0A8H6XK71_9AGAR|nr:hypothetical protein MSAN_02010400 [Mycena sanguinolenta]
MPHPVTPFKLQLRTGATLPVFPDGCTVDSAHNDTLAECCQAVGSTPVQTNEIYGCPYNAAFAPAANQSFGTCALQNGASSSCAPERTSGAFALRLRWNNRLLATSSLLVVTLLASVSVT